VTHTIQTTSPESGGSALRRWLIPMLAAVAVLVLVAATAGTRFGRGTQGGTQGFAAEVDLGPLGALAVHHEGRLKSIDSLASAQMSLVSGSRRIAGQTPTFTYFDLLFRPEAYEDADIIYVKNKPVRAQISEVLLEADPSLTERLAVFMESGLISPMLLTQPALGPLIDRLQADLIRTEKVVNALNAAMGTRAPRRLLSLLRPVPPADGDVDKQWHGFEELMPAPGPDGGLVLVPIAGLDASKQQQIASHWADLVNGWSREDATAVNASIVAMAEAIRGISPETYPSPSRLRLESWYFAVDNMSWVWLVYMFATLPLLMWAVFRWPMALRLGISLFAVGFLLQTAAVGIRWYISARWPNSNMFEAVTTASWFGACAAVVLEILVRGSIMRGLFLLTAAFSSLVALMAAHFLPAYLNPSISNMMPVLNDVWLYIHTNVIIFSYCLIFMAAISAILYLGWRFIGGGPDFARVGGAGSLMMPTRQAAVATSAGVVMLAREPDESSLAMIGGGATGVAGGDLGSGGGSIRRVSPGEVFDGVTMVLMELSFILLWAGIVMGAIWADHSWGRPWGWDPKEVFALNTFIVFAVLVHVRLKAKDKGLWTAILAVIGAGVMLFNWIVINFVISGLHSYA